MTRLIVRPTGRTQLYLAEPRRLVVFLTLLGAAAGCVASWTSAEPAGVSEAAPSCQSVLECRTLVERTRQDLRTCRLSCEAERANHEAARDQFRLALEAEHQAVYQHERRALEEERERKLAEQVRVQNDLKIRQTEQQLAQQAAVRDHELELLRVKHQFELDRERLGFDRVVAYFKQLTAGQRRDRLATCHERGSQDCQMLAEQLVRAAGNLAEARGLAARHETYRIDRSASGSPESRTDRRSTRGSDLPVQCCDGTLSLGCSCENPGAGCCSAQGGSCGCADKS